MLLFVGGASCRTGVVVQVTVSGDLALPKPALAKDKRCQEEAAAEKCQADDKCFMMPIIPHDPVDAAIRRIWADCTLRAAPLDAILAKIDSNKSRMRNELHQQQHCHI